MECMPMQFDTYLSYILTLHMRSITYDVSLISCGGFKRIDYAQMSFKRMGFSVGLSLFVSSQASLYSLSKIK